VTGLKSNPWAELTDLEVEFELQLDGKGGRREEGELVAGEENRGAGRRELVRRLEVTAFGWWLEGMRSR
jgi:hypothetical protein